MKTNSCVMDSDAYMGRTPAICKHGVTAAKSPLLFLLANVSGMPLRLSLLHVESSSAAAGVRFLKSVSSYARTSGTGVSVAGRHAPSTLYSK
eukprot:6157853-Prorocentrum_lima.AAC.1